MTALRLIPLQIHSAVEMVAGLLLMAAPFVLGLSTAAMVSGVVIGALLVGTALQALDGEGRTFSVSAHWAADYGMALGLIGAALVIATVDAAAALLFGAFGLAQFALNLTTRYSRA